MRSIPGPPQVGFISAAQATEIAMHYVASVAKAPDVSVDEVTLNRTKRMWEIHGAYRTYPFVRASRFHVQLVAESGGVIGFACRTRPSLAPLLMGTAVIIGTLLFSVWLFILNR